MSVKREFAQRAMTKVEEVKVVNDGGTLNLNLDPTYCNMFNVNLDGLESYNENIVRPYDYGDSSGVPHAINTDVYYFKLNVDNTLAAVYPGLEFTIFFTTPNFFNATISLYYDNDSSDILSPVNALNYYRDISVTLKSNGKRFSVISSGPRAWAYGPYA